MKNINLTLKPVHYAKLTGLALIVFWMLTFNQRIQVLGKYGVGIRLTDMTQFKYLAGISHSAEEMEFLLEMRKNLR